MAAATGTLIGMGIMAALSAAQNQAQQQQANDQKEANKAITRYSPWTGMKPIAVQNPNLLGNVAAGAASGAQLGGQFDHPGAATPNSVANGGSGNPSTQPMLGQTATASPYSLGANAPMQSNPYSLMPPQGSAGAYGSPWMGMNPYSQYGTNPDPLAVYGMNK